MDLGFFNSLTCSLLKRICIFLNILHLLESPKEPKGKRVLQDRTAWWLTLYFLKALTVSWNSLSKKHWAFNPTNALCTLEIESPGLLCSNSSSTQNFGCSYLNYCNDSPSDTLKIHLILLSRVNINVLNLLLVSCLVSPWFWFLQAKI